MIHEQCVVAHVLCFPPKEYLDAVKNFTMFDPLIRNVIVTSEDSSACSDFIAMLKRELPTLRIITNGEYVAFNQHSHQAADPAAMHAIIDRLDHAVKCEKRGSSSLSSSDVLAYSVGDVQQGTGSASKLEAYKEAVDNAEVVASALTSFHMHMRAR